MSSDWKSSSSSSYRKRSAMVQGGESIHTENGGVSVSFLSKKCFSQVAAPLILELSSVELTRYNQQKCE